MLSEYTSAGALKPGSGLTAMFECFVDLALDGWYGEKPSDPETQTQRAVIIPVFDREFPPLLKIWGGGD